MVQRTKKKTLLLLGLIAGGVAGIFGSYLKANFLKETSLIIPVANADIGGWGGGSDAGGCSGGDTGY